MPCGASVTEPAVLGLTPKIDAPTSFGSESLPNGSGAWLVISPVRAFNSSRSRPRLFQPSDNVIPFLFAVRTLIAAARIDNIKVTLPVQGAATVNADPCQFANAEEERLEAN